MAELLVLENIIASDYDSNEFWLTKKYDILYGNDL